MRWREAQRVYSLSSWMNGRGKRVRPIYQGVALCSLVTIVLCAVCGAQSSTIDSVVRTGATQPPPLTMTDGFRKSARLAIQEYQRALNGGLSKDSRQAALDQAATQLEKLHTEAQSPGDKAAHDALMKLAVLVKTSRMEELLYVLGPPGADEKSWQEAEHQAQDCARRLRQMMKKSKYATVGSCQLLPKLWQPRCGEPVPVELTRAGWVVPCVVGGH